MPSHAQFYTGDCGPVTERWSQLRTDNYRIIYPRGLDTLGWVYASALESVRDAVGATAGFSPNEKYRRPMPVILHVWNTVPNGMVTWTPRRMELQTTPESFAPLPMPWATELAIHESRHVAQMQYVNDGYFKPFGVLTGQLVAGGLAALYCGPSFFEGDAVVAETALSATGRGRNADFLEYYRASFSDGQRRSWWQWRYGSIGRFTPDYYRIGYITAAGIRTLYDAPDFTARYYARLSEHFFPVCNWQKTIRETCGKGFRDAFDEICDTLAVAWQRDSIARGPFMPCRRISAPGHDYTSYRGCVSLRGDIYAIRSGISGDTRLVRILPDGTETALARFSPLAEKLSASERDALIWWSENVCDPRWKNRWWSDVFCIDRNGIISRLTRKGRYFNPAPSEVSDELAVCCQKPDGGSAICVLSSLDGSVIRDYKAPDGLTMSEVCWVGDCVYALGTSSAGSGLYRADRGFERVSEPAFHTLSNLFSRDGKLYFTSDADGVDELFCLNPADEALSRVTNLSQGASGYAFCGRELYFCIPETGGRPLCCTDVADLPICRVADVPEAVWPFADELSEGEPPLAPAGSLNMSGPEKYSRAAHLINVHSWLPAYVSFDDVSTLSAETLLQSAGLGATAFFQNELSSVTGSAGYRYSLQNGRSSGHLNIVCKSLPVALQGKLDFNDSERSEVGYEEKEGETEPYSKGLGGPGINGSLKAYLPLSWFRQGWTDGFIPSFTYAFSNDVFRVSDDFSATLSRATASLRAYRLRPTLPSCYYPELGIGAELGAVFRPGLVSEMSPSAYFMTYAYLPGPGCRDGFKLTFLHNRRSCFLRMPDPSISTVPRGFGEETLEYMSMHKFQTRLTLDYAIPFASLEWDRLCPVAYVRNLELIPHADLSVYGSPYNRILPGRDVLFSAGFDFNVVLGNLACVPYVTRLGISFSCKGGPSYDATRDGGRFYLGPVFSIDM